MYLVPFLHRCLSSALYRNTHCKDILPLLIRTAVLCIIEGLCCAYLLTAVLQLQWQNIAVHVEQDLVSAALIILVLLSAYLLAYQVLLFLTDVFLLFFRCVKVHNGKEAKVIHFLSRSALHKPITRKPEECHVSLLTKPYSALSVLSRFSVLVVCCVTNGDACGNALAFLFSLMGDGWSRVSVWLPISLCVM